MAKPEDMTWFQGMEVNSVADFYKFLADADLDEDHIKPGSFIIAKWLDDDLVLMKVPGGWVSMGWPQSLGVFA